MILIAVVLIAPGLLAQASGGIAGIVTVAAGARVLSPIRVTFDQKICGTDVPDEAVVMDAARHLANVVVVLTGVTRRARTAGRCSTLRCPFRA